MTGVAINVKNDSLTVSLADFSRSYSFDRAGRLISAYVDGLNFRRGLDNRLVAKWRPDIQGVSRTPARRREVTGSEKTGFFGQLSSDSGLAESAFARGQARIISRRKREPDTRRISEWVSRVARWDAKKYDAERERFFSTYDPIMILPPDQYQALVVQLTTGCSWNRCTFCTFYNEREFCIKTEEQVADHVRAVKEFTGRSMGWRKSVFLADANALIAPQHRLSKVFALLNREFDFLPPGLRGSARWRFRAQHEWAFEGFYSFMDAFGSRLKTVNDYEALAQGHLRRVYIGLETGHPGLLEFLNKRGTPEQVVEEVRKLKSAGIQAGVVLMVGVGGVEWEDRHLHKSTEVVQAMELGEGDIVYLSPFVEHDGSDYASRRREAGLTPMSDSQLEIQLRRFRDALSFSLANRPHVSVYDIRDFVY